MNVSLEKSSLVKIVQSVQGALSNKSTMPILNGMLLEATTNNLSAYATDLEIAIKNKIEADVKKEGKAVVYGNLLIDLAKNLDDGRVTLSFDDKENKLLVKSGKSLFKLNTLPVEDCPDFPGPENGRAITLKVQDFNNAIRQVAVATSRDESRPILTGVYINLSKGNTRIAATDSYRLSLKEIRTPKNTQDAVIVVPRRAVEEVVKTTPKEGSIKVVLSEKQVAFENESFLFVSRLIGGQYPNFSQLFPKRYAFKITAKKEELLQAAKRMAVLSGAAPLILKAKTGKLTIVSKNSDVGSGEETVPIKGAGGEVEIAFNPRYLIDGLSAIDDDEVVLQLADSQQPGLLKGVRAGDYSYLIMPVRLN